MPMPPMRTRQLVADLSRELERVRREADRLLAERDDEIATLQSERILKQKETLDLYRSMDTLLGMGHGGAGGAAGLGRSSGLSQVGGSRPPSVLDRPHLQAAAQQSRNGKAAMLEQEVRHLEEEIARLGGRPAPAPASAPATQPIQPLGLSTNQPLDDTALRLTIRDLNAQVSQFRHDVADLTAERAALRRLYSDAQERLSGSDGDSHPSPRQAAAAIAQLEADRSRLALLLERSEAESAGLQDQLEDTQDQVELVSERVRAKLLEQKGKLERAREEVEGLRTALERTERELGEARRREAELENELKWVWAGASGRVANAGESRSAGSRGGFGGRGVWLARSE